MSKNKKIIISKSEKQTLTIGRKIGEKLKNGGIITLRGNLGAGKTVFVKGVARGLKIKGRITSPTFIFWRVYPIAKSNLKFFCHVDMYRLSQSDDIENIGIEEYWKRSDTVCLIEWPEKVNNLPKSNIILSVKIKIQDQNTREISITSL